MAGMVAPSVAIGAVRKVDANADAAVVNVGTARNAVFNVDVPWQSGSNVRAMVDTSLTQHDVTTSQQVAQMIANAMPAVKDGKDGKAPTNAELNALITPLIPSPIAGVNGKSAYQEWLDAGNTGSVAVFLAALKGVPGASVKGDKGDAATIAVGTVTTLAANAAATVQNVGTSSAAVFNFGIPQGIPGTTDHTQLANLTTGDPHTQYINQVRGDGRYGQLATTNTWTGNQTFTGAAAGGNDQAIGILTTYGGKTLVVRLSSKGVLALLGASRRLLYVDDP